MSYRRTPIVTGEVYHTFNRSIARQPFFLNVRGYSRAIELINFYSYVQPSLRFSHYNRLPLKEKADFLKDLKNKGRKQIQLFAFCLKPNHIHFLMKELEKNGISRFMSNFQNSYAKYFNLKNDRTGSLFQSMFKAVRIESDEQLIHVCRYIHLNPLTSYIIKDFDVLENYPWSSYSEYFKENSDLVDTSLISGFFPSIKEFEKFTSDQVDYQRQLNQIKHLSLDNRGV